MQKFKRKSLYLALVAAVCSVGIANTASSAEASALTSTDVTTESSTETIITAGSGVTKLFLPGSRFAAA